MNWWFQYFRIIGRWQKCKQIRNRKERCSKILPDSSQHNFFRSLNENVEDIVSYSFRTKQVSFLSRFFQSYSLVIYKLEFLKRHLIPSRLNAILSSSVRPTTHRHFRTVTSLASLQDRNHRSNQFVLINNHNSASRLKISQRNYASLLHRRKPLNIPPGSRGLGWIPTVVRSVLKIRYLLLGGALGGGASLAKVRNQLLLWWPPLIFLLC